MAKRKIPKISLEESRQIIRENALIKKNDPIGYKQTCRCCECGKVGIRSNNLCQACYTRDLRHKAALKKEQIDLSPSQKLKFNIQIIKENETPLQRIARVAYHVKYPTVIRQELADLVEIRLKSDDLTDAQRYCIIESHGNQRRQEDIAKELGVTRQNVQRMTKRALEVLVKGKPVRTNKAKGKEEFFFCGHKVSKRTCQVLKDNNIESLGRLGYFVKKDALKTLPGCGSVISNELTELYYNAVIRRK